MLHMLRNALEKKYYPVEIHHQIIFSSRLLSVFFVFVIWALMVYFLKDNKGII